MPGVWTGRTRRCARARSTGPTQARTDTQNVPTSAQRGPAELLMNGGPPPSLRSALHPGLHRLVETTSRARRYPSSAERNTSLCCRWIQARRLEGERQHIAAFHRPQRLPRRTRSQGTIAANCSSPSDRESHTGSRLGNPLSSGGFPPDKLTVRAFTALVDTPSGGQVRPETGPPTSLGGQASAQGLCEVHHDGSC